MRADLDIIQEWIAPGSRVLDLGCGDGELLAWLRDNKQVAGYGLEIDPDKIALCIERHSISWGAARCIWIAESFLDVRQMAMQRAEHGLRNARFAERHHALQVI